MIVSRQSIMVKWNPKITHSHQWQPYNATQIPHRDVGPKGVPSMKDWARLANFGRALVLVTLINLIRPRDPQMSFHPSGVHISSNPLPTKAGESSPQQPWHSSNPKDSASSFLARHPPQFQYIFKLDHIHVLQMDEHSRSSKRYENGHSLVQSPNTTNDFSY